MVRDICVMVFALCVWVVLMVVDHGGPNAHLDGWLHIAIAVGEVDAIFICAICFYRSFCR